MNGTLIHRCYPQNTPSPLLLPPPCIIFLRDQVQLPAHLSNKGVHFLHHPLPICPHPPRPLRLTQRGHFLGEVRLAQAPEAGTQHFKWWRPSECPWEGEGKACPWVPRSRSQGTSRKKSLLIGRHGSCSVGIPWNLQWRGESSAAAPAHAHCPGLGGSVPTLAGLPTGSPRVLERK